MAIYQNSRLIGSNVYLDENNEAYIEPKINFISTGAEDSLYQFKEGDRLDILAKNLYGNAQLKHIILRANPRYMIEDEITIGDWLNIPNPLRSDLIEQDV